MNQAIQRVGTSGPPSKSESDVPSFPPPEVLQARVDALNASLKAEGSPLRVSEPLGATGKTSHRDRISVQLMAVLQASRNRDAFELLYLLNARTIHLYCKSRLRVRYPSCRCLDAGDVVDEAFMNIYLRCETFRVSRNTSFMGWALVVAENIIRQDQRSRARQGGSGLPLGEQLTDDQPGPQARALQSEARVSCEEGWVVFVRLCAAGIFNLPARWRRVLEMREGECLTYREIGRQLNLSTGHVGMLIRRARLKVLRQVRAALDRYK